MTIDNYVSLTFLLVGVTSLLPLEPTGVQGSKYLVVSFLLSPMLSQETV